MEKVEFKCKVCNNTFYVYKHDQRIKRGLEIKYCSRKCMGLGARTRKIVVCKYCGKQFETTRNDCCSKECGIKYKVANYKHKTYEENGYIVRFINGYNKKGNVKQHRYVMEQFLNRKLNSNEIVHHINGNKKDNRIENLEIMTPSEHSKYHRELDLANGKELFGR